MNQKGVDGQPRPKGPRECEFESIQNKCWMEILGVETEDKVDKDCDEKHDGENGRA